jgi:hypothetical protein
MFPDKELLSNFMRKLDYYEGMPVKEVGEVKEEKKACCCKCLECFNLARLKKRITEGFKTTNISKVYTLHLPEKNEE